MLKAQIDHVLVRRKTKKKPGLMVVSIMNYEQK